MGGELPEDTIRVKNLSLTASFTDGAQWQPSAPNKAKLQPISITLSISLPTSVAAASDNLAHSISYSDLAKIATEIAGSKAFTSTEELVYEIHARCAAQFPGIQESVRQVANVSCILSFLKSS